MLRDKNLTNPGLFSIFYSKVKDGLTKAKECLTAPSSKKPYYDELIPPHFSHLETNKKK